jgi:iron complex transport system permease protein
MSRSAWILIGLTLALAIAAVLRLNVGQPRAALDADAWEAITALRTQRAFLAGTVGAALGGAGVLLQYLLRNPLVSPDVMGPSSGASLGVMISIAIWPAGIGFGSLAWQAGPALTGAMVAMLLITLLARRRAGLDPGVVIITGVVVSIMCGAGVVFVQHLINATSLSGRSLALLVGAISDETPRGHIVFVACVTALVVGIGCAIGRTLDAMSMSEDEAISVGVPLARTRAIVFVGAGILTSGAVVLAGPVGFVGLIAPHIVRLMLGTGGSPRRQDFITRHIGRAGTLLIGSCLCGAALLILGDTGVRAIDLGAGRMPIGVITALLGGPLLIALLGRSGGGGGGAATRE